MKIFINDIPVYLLDHVDLKPISEYDLIVDSQLKKINPKELLDDVLVTNASKESVDELLHLMTDKKFKGVDSITFSSDQVENIKAYIKEKFKVIEAAGGVVEKDSKYLLIFREGKWDFPKGKLDKAEKKKIAAIREVEEETGVKVAIQQKIGHTWHTYIRNRRYVLKKTHWYWMRCIDDSAMAPQVAEGIEDVKWMTLTETRVALYDSYRSIRSVLQEYHKLIKLHHGFYKE